MVDKILNEYRETFEEIVQRIESGEKRWAVFKEDQYRELAHACGPKYGLARMVATFESRERGTLSQ
jgi:hypothetical protein